MADFNTSALAEHAWTNHHHVNWDGVSVLSWASDAVTRVVKESVFIRRTKDTLNRDIGALPVEYHTLFPRSA